MQQPADEDPDDLHHSLLNHLAVITTNAHLLKDSTLDDDQKEIVADIADAADQARILLQKLIGFIGSDPDDGAG